MAPRGTHYWLADLTLLRQDYRAESKPVPVWQEDSLTAATPYIHHCFPAVREIILMMPKGSPKSKISATFNPVWQSQDSRGQVATG
ncbi:MAG: hypothetical protein MJA27_09725 [Pseudanabaenales cyanobacterium]|nr:hypothetical protein [Pseudanabaenales cyanobacterium]